MTTLEALAEVLAVHSAKRPWSDGGVMRCTCGERFVAELVPHLYHLHRAHLTEMLAPVITSSNAKAWHEGFNDGKRQDAEGDDGPRFTNPYHADSLDAS